MNKQTMLSGLLALCLALSGCGGIAQTEASVTQTSAEIQIVGTEAAVPTASAVDPSDMFTDRDLRTEYDVSDCIPITLSGSTAACDGSGVSISGSVVTIEKEGVYLLSGALDNGQIRIEAGDSDKVQLILDNVSISCVDSAAIYVVEADKVFLTTASGSENTLSNGGSYVQTDDNNVDGVVFSKSDLTLNGTGSLTIRADAGHGVVSKDDLVVGSGTYVIDAASHGLSGKDSVRIANGSFTLTTGKDGIHAENADDDSLGFLYIAGGTFVIAAEGDGLSSGSYLLAEDGDFTITAGGGCANASQKTDVQAFGRGTWESSQTDTEETASTKGVKAAGNLTINGGSYVLDTADDGVHSNSAVTIHAGAFSIASGDDGIHADDALVVNGGTIHISQSYEGLEGMTLDLNGGEIDLTASDDGLNAAGGNDSSGFGGRGGDQFAASEGVYIRISGGYVHINAGGDGIDSNGDLYVTGGTVYVSGPTDNGNGALDYNGEASITGGTVIAAGSSGMAQTFGSSSTQGVITVTTGSCPAGSTIALADSGGTVLVSWQADKAFDCVVLSCPDIQVGETYTLTAGDTATEIVMDSLSYGSAAAMGGGFGGGMDRGGRGQMPMDEDMSRPTENGMGQPMERPSGSRDRQSFPDQPPSA